ncbi:MAG: outer membrane protein assembly factor BamD [Gammaproteobacteria bacterium]|nr:outer membrane protein assembly factor BamD [Gammaproteobacteria bacterium]
MPGDAYPDPRRIPRRPPFPIPAFVLLTALALGVAACGGTAHTRPDATSDAAALYQAGHAAMQQEDYAGAVRQFLRLESLYPEDPNAQQGQVELIYAYYKQGDVASVLMSSDRLIRERPDHPNLDYVYYLRGLAMFNQAQEALAQEQVEIRPRPPTADLALEYFGALIERYPGSKYAGDARARVLHLQNGLAAFEVTTAKIYINHGDYVNAGLHARAALENYPDSGTQTEAAAVANIAYRMLDLQRGQSPTGAPTPALPVRPDIAAHDTAPDGGETRTVATPPPQETRTADAATAPTATDDAPAPAAPQQEAAGSPPPGAPQGADWIARQPPEAYTLQLFSVADLAAVRRFARAHPLDGLAWFETRREGYPWYSMIRGVYPDAASARAAAAALPEALRLQPWIRRLGDIQALIETETPAP